MRRLTAIPVKTSAVAVLIMSGAVYVAAEARQVVIRKQQREIARIEDSALTPFNPAASAVTPVVMNAAPSAAVPAIAQNPRQQVDELTAEKLAASMPAQKAIAGNDGHRRQIIISIPDRRLALVEDGKLVKTYAIAVGARVSPSPDGDFSVINHAIRPTYRHAGKEILPGKDNPLGTRWIGLSRKGYGIHGTNVPSSIGKAASHGCFRMGQADVEDLYSRVEVGDTVTVRRQRDELIARVFDIGAPVTVATNATAGSPVNQLSVKAASPNDSQMANASATGVLSNQAN
jgi:lipoprotein-anchoring transpeptidase ErfK/SrfK